MKEFITSVIVIDREPVREFDEEFRLYSREFGYITARATSSRKISSKFSHHLNVLNRVKVRLVGANSLIIADAVLENNFPHIRKNSEEFVKALRVASLIRAFFPRGGIDEEIWDFLNKDLERGEINISNILSSFGYDAGTASCTKCGNAKTRKFFIKDHSFWCLKCGFKIPDSEILYIN